MNFLQYSNENQVNIIPQESFQELTRDVFNVIAENLCKSLGPLGSSATILDGSLTEATKDGYSILMKYRFHNRYKNMIYNLIKAPCTKMNNTVGDGTTTSIALTNAMYQILTSKESQDKINSLFRLPRDFVKEFDYVVKELQEMVKKRATPVNPYARATIYNIAYVTSNGNEEVSKEIANLYVLNHSPYIKQKDSPTNKSYISASEGFEYPATLIDIIFTTNEDSSTVVKNPAIMVFDHKIETDTFNIISQINTVMRAMDKKLIIIAPQYDTYMLDTIANKVINAERSRYGNTNLILAQYHTGKLAAYQTEDLCAVLKCRAISVDMDTSLRDNISLHSNIDVLVEKVMEEEEYEFYGIIGEAAEVMISLNGDAVFKADESIVENPHYKRTLLNAKKELEDIVAKTDEEKLSYSAKIYDANSRVLRLEMKTFIYYIGADSALQKQILWDSVEDVIKCLRSAIKYGIVPGCQIELMRCASAYLGDRTIDKIVTGEDRVVEQRKFIAGVIFEALKNVYTMVLRGPNGDGILKLSNVDKVEANIFPDDEERTIYEIIRRSLKTREVFDLETLSLNKDIVTSVETDIMVLSVAAELVKILISGNQCIFVDAELNGVHQTQAADLI